VNRIGAMVLRHWYLMRGSWTRVTELIYWPATNLILWGLIQSFLNEQSSYFAAAAGVFIGSVMLWEVLFRSQMGVAISFFEEMYSRNLGHLLVSPLKPTEFMISLIVVAFLRTVFAMGIVSIMAIWFFGFSLFDLGLATGAFFFNLAAFGWAVGLMVIGIVLRYGLGAETIAWGVMFGLTPFCAVYYPSSILPDWSQGLVAVLPPSYVFDGLRAILIEKRFDPSLMVIASLLNVVWLAAGALVYLAFDRSARINGALIKIGE
jgi:ABC-2 type transport system permease protein